MCTSDAMGQLTASKVQGASEGSGAPPLLVRLKHGWPHEHNGRQSLQTHLERHSAPSTPATTDAPAMIDAPSSCLSGSLRTASASTLQQFASIVESTHILINTLRPSTSSQRCKGNNSLVSNFAGFQAQQQCHVCMQHPTLLPCATLPSSSHASRLSAALPNYRAA